MFLPLLLDSMICSQILLNISSNEEQSLQSFTTKLFQCILPMHLEEFLQAYLAECTSSSLVSEKYPFKLMLDFTQFQRASISFCDKSLSNQRKEASNKYLRLYNSKMFGDVNFDLPWVLNECPYKYPPSTIYAYLVFVEKYSSKNSFA